MSHGAPIGRNAVFVGGYGSTKSSVDRIGDALCEGGYYEDVSPYTLAKAHICSAEIARLTANDDLITFSAGATIVERCQPCRLTAIGAPLPSRWYTLAARTTVRTARLLTPGLGVRGEATLEGVCRYVTSGLSEIMGNTGFHRRVLERLRDFSMIEVAVDMVQRGVAGVELIYNRDDAFFRPSGLDRAICDAAGIPIRYLPGEHDEVAIRPKEFLAMVFEADDCKKQIESV